MSFSDKKVAELVNSKFVAAWTNRGPGFNNTEFWTEKGIASRNYEAYPTKNIRTFFLTPDGKAFYFVKRTPSTLQSSVIVICVSRLDGDRWRTPEEARGIWISPNGHHRIIAVPECDQQSHYEHLVFQFWKHHPAEKAKLAAQATWMMWNPQVGITGAQESGVDSVQSPPRTRMRCVRGQRSSTAKHVQEASPMVTSRTSADAFGETPIKCSTTSSATSVSMPLEASNRDRRARCRTRPTGPCTTTLARSTKNRQASMKSGIADKADSIARSSST